MMLLSAELKVASLAEGVRVALIFNYHILRKVSRGLAGTVLVYKIAGELARQGRSLDDVYDVAEYVANNVVTVGCGLEHCHVRKPCSLMF
jgi:dihydroxyacetone kinase